MQLTHFMLHEVNDGISSYQYINKLMCNDKPQDFWIYPGYHSKTAKGASISNTFHIIFRVAQVLDGKLKGLWDVATVAMWWMQRPIHTQKSTNISVIMI